MAQWRAKTSKLIVCRSGLYSNKSRKIYFDSARSCRQCQGSGVQTSAIQSNGPPVWRIHLTGEFYQRESGSFRFRIQSYFDVRSDLWAIHTAACTLSCDSCLWWSRYWSRSKGTAYTIPRSLSFLVECGRSRIPILSVLCVLLATSRGSNIRNFRLQVQGSRRGISRVLEDWGKVCEAMTHPVVLSYHTSFFL